jgi:hypothetical protein
MFETDKDLKAAWQKDGQQRKHCSSAFNIQVTLGSTFLYHSMREGYKERDYWGEVCPCL